MPVSGQTTYPARGETAAPVPPAVAPTPGGDTPIVAVLGRGDIAVQGRGIIDVPGCTTVEVL